MEEVKTLYQKTFDAESPCQYEVGVYEKDGVRYFQVLKVIWAKGWIETNLTLTQDQDEVLSAMAEAIAEVRKAVAVAGPSNAP